MKSSRIFIKIFALVIVLALTVPMFASCSGGLFGMGNSDLEFAEDLEILREEYEDAVDDGYDGSFEDWMSDLLDNNGEHVHKYTNYNVALSSSGAYVLKATCEECGEEITTEVHVHIYSDYWSYNETHHWMNSSCGHENGAMEEHSLNSKGECGVCGYGMKGASEGLDYTLRTGLSEYAVTGIGSCTDREIVIPEEYEGLPVTEIADEAFRNETKIISVSLPDSIVKIGNKAFAECDNLVEVKMPENIEIGLDVFRDSINVEVKVDHNLEYVPAIKSTCSTAGNIEHYICYHCGNTYSDENGENRIYDISVPAAHRFVGGYCEMCNTPDSALRVVYIESVDYLGKFALGTMENAIGLPKTVRVQTADLNIYDLDVVWDLSGYKKNAVGTYTINGYLKTDGLIFDETSGISNRISTTIDVVDYMEGTADIVFVIDTTGSMSSYINSVKNNIISLAQEIENAGVSARWALVDYRDITCDGQYSTHIVMNGASEWYVSAEQYREAIAGLYVDGGGDAPECAIDGLMMATTIETRKDTRTFYILVTDIGYKVDNNYGVDSMEEMAEILVENNIYTSVVCPTENYYEYKILTESTDGVFADIYSNFQSVLLDSLVKKIQEKVEA